MARSANTRQRIVFEFFEYAFTANRGLEYDPLYTAIDAADNRGIVILRIPG